MPAFTPQSQSITALWLVQLNPGPVTHSSTNRVLIYVINYLPVVSNL